jgi:hypothetical protein
MERFAIATGEDRDSINLNYPEAIVEAWSLAQVHKQYVESLATVIGLPDVEEFTQNEVRLFWNYLDMNRTVPDATFMMLIWRLT